MTYTVFADANLNPSLFLFFCFNFPTLSSARPHIIRDDFGKKNCHVFYGMCFCCSVIIMLLFFLLRVLQHDDLCNSESRDNENSCSH